MPIEWQKFREEVEFGFKLEEILQVWGIWVFQDEKATFTVTWK